MLQKLSPLPRTLPLHGLAASRAIEAAALAGRPHDELMERAGLAVARLALALQPGPGAIWIACGPGHNGEDGRIAARWLQAAGREVHIALTPPPGPPGRIALVIDALLGLGVNRAPGDAMAAAVAAINAAGAPVLSVDLPSGLLADTGQPAGASAVRASHTLQLLTLKPGPFTGEGRTFSGALWFDDLGIRPDVPPDALLLGRDQLRRAPRGATSHKGSHGDVLVAGGAPGMSGAALLAARAALAAGAGRVYAPAPDPGRPELMHLAGEDATGKTVVAGCGGGREIATPLPALLRDAARLVLDADALNAISADGSLRQLLRARQAPTVLTPHPLEAARLLGCTTAEVQADRLRAAQGLAEALGCIVVLKGSGSVIAAPGRTPCINSSGGPALATAGTGDVLAGWLGGLWAQGLPAFEAACAAVHGHGLAGERQPAGPLRAADLIERMHALHGQFSDMIEPS